MKTIVITGVTKGIGLAVGKRFLAEGWRVIGCASTKSSLEQLRHKYPQIEVMQCDITDNSQLDEFVRNVLEKYPQIDVLVNNAGKFKPGQIYSEDEGVLEDMLSVNLIAPYNLTRRFLPSMMKRRGGTIINICSTASITPYMNGSSYGIAKFGLLGMTRILRQELIPYHIRVIGVLPGATLTASWSGTELPSERFMKPEHVAELIWAANALPQGTVVEEILVRPMEGDIM